MASLATPSTKTGGKKKGKASSRIRETAERAGKYMPRLKAAAMETGTVVGFAALGSLASGYRDGRGGLQLWKGEQSYKKVTDLRLVGGVLGMIAAIWKPSKASALLVNASTGLITSYAAEMAHGYGDSMGDKREAAKTVAKGVEDDDETSGMVVVGRIDESGKLTLEQKIQRAKRRGHVKHATKLMGKQESLRAARQGESVREYEMQHPGGRDVQATPGRW